MSRTSLAQVEPDLLGERKKSAEQSMDGAKTQNAPTQKPGEVAPSEKKSESMFLMFISQLMHAKGDLSAITCPAFLMCGESLLEYPVSWMVFPQLMGQISGALTPERESCCHFSHPMRLSVLV